MGAVRQIDKAKREDINKLKRAFAYNLFYKQGTAVRTATLNDYLSVGRKTGTPIHAGEYPGAYFSLLHPAA